MKLSTTFYRPYREGDSIRHAEIGNHVLVRGAKGHITKLGRKYVEVLFYPGEAIKGRHTVDLFNEDVVLPGTSHV